MGRMTGDADDPEAPDPLVGSTLASGRLPISSRIGAGGSGVVYAAFDRDRGCRVALKTLPWLEGDAIYALKNEFRQLVDVQHPNLVRMFELFGDDERWFFTMELIDGQPFDAWVRPEQLNLTRLRGALDQLVSAVSAIHAQGKLHRDLKPSNVLVTPEGRVVVLDFGLLIDSELGGVGRTVPEFRIDGTPAYMSPEQAAGQPATRASDCYAIGVMLFQALTGRLPFEGRPGAMIAAKQFRAAASPATLQHDLPADLVELCEQLLAREPAARPDVANILERTQRASTPPRARSEPATFPPLQGREQPLGSLQRAFALAESGTPSALFITGESGSGKTALCDTFARQLTERNAGVVLRARCYERESVPFKALDPLVDALGRHLRRLPQEEATAVLPREVFALAKLFPALERISLVAALPGTSIADPLELRSRAFAALGEWLARIRDLRPVLVYIDDLHWACAGSIAGLSQLLSDPQLAPLLLVLTSRSSFDELREAASRNPRLSLQELTLGP